MPVDPEYLRQYYASFSDEGLLAVNRAELTEIAQRLYDSELGQRGLLTSQDAASPANAPAEEAVAEAYPRTPFWSLNLRKAALITAIMGVLGILIPGWSTANSLLAADSSQLSQVRGRIPAIALDYLLGAILPVFYFALYRNKGMLRFSRSSRLAALLGVFGFGLLAAIELWQWISGFIARGTAGVLGHPDYQWMSDDFSALLGPFGRLVFTIPLIAIFRQEGDESDAQIPISKSLRIISRASVIVWGLPLALQLIALAFSPYIFQQVRQAHYRLGNTPPRLADMYEGATYVLLCQVCNFAVPCIIWRSIRRATHARPGAE